MYGSISRRLALAAALAAASGAAVAETLDFGQCVEAALARNPDLAIQQSRIDQSEAMLRQAEGGRLPRLSLSLTATHSNDPLNAFGLKLEQQRVDPATDFSAQALNHPKAINNFNTRIEVQAPVYTGGQLTAQAEQARALVRTARQGDAAARQDLIRQVATAYQGVHSARAYIGVAEQGEATAREALRVSEVLLRQGMTVKSDVLTARVNLEDARLRVAEARRREAGAMDRLKLLLGRPLDEPLDVAAPLVVSLPAESEPMLTQRALQEHPALAALRNQVDAGRAQVNAARAGRRPQASVLARQDWNDNGIGLDASSYTLAGVVSWTAFDGGVTDARVDHARAARAEAAARLRQAEDGVVFELREARRLAQEAETRLTAREAAVLDAEEAQRLVRKRYENGLTTLVDLLSVQAQLDKARGDRVAAGHELAVSRIDLRRAAGILTADNL